MTCQKSVLIKVLFRNTHSLAMIYLTDNFLLTLVEQICMNYQHLLIEYSTYIHFLPIPNHISYDNIEGEIVLYTTVREM